MNRSALDEKIRMFREKCSANDYLLNLRIAPRKQVVYMFYPGYGMPSTKRPDLQGIRGLAILAVLLFHFFPKWFPNGYVGVDQFFILSGYLMAKILSKETSMGFIVLYNFYYRRIKRILPLYAMFILVTIYLSVQIFTIDTFEFNYPHAIRSLAFISNADLGDKAIDYQRQLLDAEIVFTHTWSLSAEVQFYVVAPFVILISIYMTTKLYLGLIFVLGAASCFSFHYLLQTEETKSFSFNSMLTRIWQFLLGVACYSIAKLNSPKVNEKIPLPTINNTADENKTEQTLPKEDRLSSEVVGTVTLLCSTLVAFYPWDLQQSLVRFLVCFQTASLIFSGSNYGSRLLSNPGIVYLGDISYSLYLVHWPVYVYVKQYCLYNTDFNTVKTVGLPALFIGLAVSFLLAVIFYEIYEKFYLKQKEKVIITLCIILYLLSFGVIYYYIPVDVGMKITDELFSVPSNLTNKEVTRINNLFSQYDQRILEHTRSLCTGLNPGYGEGYCTYNNLTYSGKKKVMLLGNSFAINMARGFIQNKDCLSHASEILIMYQYGCQVFDLFPDNPWCLKEYNSYMATVEAQKPHVLFILQRFHHTNGPINETKDDALHFEKHTLIRLRKAVQEKIFILTAAPTLVKDLTERIDAGLKSGKMPTFEEILNDEDEHEHWRQRVARISKECPKCVILDLKPNFTLNGTFQFYNRENGIVYFSKFKHLSDYGLAKVAPMFSDACKRI